MINAACVGHSQDSNLRMIVRTHEAAEMCVLQCRLSLIDSFKLHKGVGALDLHAHQAPIWIKVLLKVPLARLLHIEVHHKQCAGGLDVAAPLVLPSFYVTVPL